MIALERPPAPEPLRNLCSAHTEKIRGLGATGRAAQDEWKAKAAEPAKLALRTLLEQMAPGVHRCMYCLDSVGTDIDHFEPKSRRPLRTFCWHNLLLACSRCNSKYKREQYPCDEFGQCLLIDPTLDDPSDHLLLLPEIGTFKARTRKGRTTEQVLHLNRAELVEGRQLAYTSCCDQMVSWHRKVRRGDLEGAGRSAKALRREPFVDVLHALEDLGRLPYAAQALRSGELAEAVTAWLAGPGTTGEHPVSAPPHPGVHPVSVSIPPARGGRAGVP